MEIKYRSYRICQKCSGPIHKGAVIAYKANKSFATGKLFHRSCLARASQSKLIEVFSNGL